VWKNKTTFITTDTRLNIQPQEKRAEGEGVFGAAPEEESAVGSERGCLRRRWWVTPPPPPSHPLRVKQLSPEACQSNSRELSCYTGQRGEAAGSSTCRGNTHRGLCSEKCVPAGVQETQLITTGSLFKTSDLI